MSYDLTFFFPKPGEDPLESYYNQPPYDPDAERVFSDASRQRIAAIIAKLKEHSPDLEVYEEEDCVEIFTAEELELGITISFYEHDAGLSIPFWHTEEAPKVCKLVSDYLRIICEVGGYAVYDRQAEKIIDASCDYNFPLSSYGYGVACVEKTRADPYANTCTEMVSIPPRAAKPAAPQLPAVSWPGRPHWRIALLLVTVAAMCSQYYMTKTTLKPPPALSELTSAAPKSEYPYTLTVDKNLFVTRTEGPQRWLKWIVMSEGKVVSERYADDSPVFSYRLYDAGQTYTVHLEAQVNGVNQVVSNTVTLKP